MPHEVPSATTPARARRAARARGCARAVLVLVLASALPVEPARAGSGERPVLELPPAACDVCTPGKEPPPAEVADRTRQLNQDVNWRQRPAEGDTIPLGTATRVWLQRAWASGRLQSGVATTSGSSVAGRGAMLRGGARARARSSLAARSRERLADRRSTRDQGRSRRGRRGSEESSSASARSSGLGTASSLGTNRSNSTFGPSSFSSNNGGFNSE